MNARSLWWSMLLAGLIAACSAPGSDNPPPATTNGQELFELKAVGRSPGCVTCHSLSPDVVLVGPSLAGVADRAGARVDGLNADEYIRQSIIAPSDHVVGSFDADKMPGDYGDILTDVQIDALVEFLQEST